MRTECHCKTLLKEKSSTLARLRSNNNQLLRANQELLIALTNYNSVSMHALK